MLDWRILLVAGILNLLATLMTSDEKTQTLLVFCGFCCLIASWAEMVNKHVEESEILSHDPFVFEDE